MSKITYNTYRVTFLICGTHSRKMVEVVACDANAACADVCQAWLDIDIIRVEAA